MGLECRRRPCRGLEGVGPASVAEPSGDDEHILDRTPYRQGFLVDKAIGCSIKTAIASSHPGCTVI